MCQYYHLQFFTAILEYDQVELLLVSFGELFFKYMVNDQSERNLPSGIFAPNLH